MPRLLSEIQDNFSRGMDDSSAPSAHAAAAAALIENGRIEPDGTISRRYGSRRKHASAQADLLGYGATTFTTAAGVLQEIALFGEYAFMSDDGWATQTQIASGLREDYYDFVTMRVGSSNYLFMANGDTTIKRWDGTTWDTLPNAPSGVKYIELFNERLYATGHSGVLVQASKIADPATWASSDGLTVRVLTHDGDSPTGLHQIGPHLLVFDHHATSYIDGFGEQTLIVASGATGFSRSVGCVAFRTIVSVGDDAVCWLGHRGIEYYSARTGIVLLTRRIQTFMNSINHSAIDAARGLPSAAYDQERQNYHCAVPTLGTQNNRIVVVNLYHRGTGWLGAPSIDLKETESIDAVLLGDDASGYEEEDAAGYGLRSDINGYEVLDTISAGAIPIAADASGYEDEVTDDTFPSSLYMGPGADSDQVLHSQGYDGFVREHGGYDQDDELVPGGSGQDITMTVVSRPFVMGSQRRAKRARAVHIAGIQTAAVTYEVGVRASGVLGTLQDVDLAGTAFNQPDRAPPVMVHGVGDAPAVEVRTTDRSRLALLGLSAEPTREPL